MSSDSEIPDASAPEPDIAALAKDKRLARECAGLRSDLRLLMGSLGLTARTQIPDFVKKAAARPEEEPEPAEPEPAEPAPASDHARELAVWRLVARARALDPKWMADLLFEATSGVGEDGSPLDPGGEPYTIEAIRAALPGFVAASPGVGGGSGGRTPAPMPAPPSEADPVEQAINSQRFFENNRSAVLAAERAGH